MSNQEHHEKKNQYIKSNVPQPSHICVIANHFDCNVRSNKSITKKGSIMSIQEHHEKRINNVNSRAPRKKESICQFKSTMKKGSICQFKSITKKKDQYVKSR